MDWRRLAIAILVVIALMFFLSGDLPPGEENYYLRPVQSTWHTFLDRHATLFTFLFIASIITLFVLPKGGGGGGAAKH